MDPTWKPVLIWMQLMILRKRERSLMIQMFFRDFTAVETTEHEHGSTEQGEPTDQAEPTEQQTLGSRLTKNLPSKWKIQHFIFFHSSKANWHCFRKFTVNISVFPKQKSVGMVITTSTPYEFQEERQNKEDEKCLKLKNKAASKEKQNTKNKRLCLGTGVAFKRKKIQKKKGGP